MEIELTPLQSEILEAMKKAHLEGKQINVNFPRGCGKQEIQKRFRKWKQENCDHYYVPIGGYHQMGRFYCKKCGHKI